MIKRPCHFELRIRWTESSDFGPKFDLGNRILKSDFTPSDFAISDCIGLHKKADLFMRSKSKNLKLGIGSHKKQPRVDVKMWRYRVDVVPNIPKCPVPASMFYRYRYQLRYLSLIHI